MTIEFIDDGHYYLIEGVIVPSVSEILRFKFPDAYAGIPEKVLKKKASYGTKLHQTIEDFIEKKFTLEELEARNIDPDIKIAVEQFENLRKEWIFTIKSIEQIVNYKDHYAGTYDLKTTDNLIIDIKSTAVLHEDMLALQIGLYYLADNNPQEKGYCMWFPKGKAAQVKEIQVVGFDECKKIIEEYEKHTAK